MQEIPTAHLELLKAHLTGRDDIPMAKTGWTSLEIGLDSRMWRDVVDQQETIAHLVARLQETGCSSS